MHWNGADLRAAMFCYWRCVSRFQRRRCRSSLRFMRWPELCLLRTSPWRRYRLAFMFTMVMISTIPASLFMRRYGRRVGFTLGQTIGTIAALISVYAIYQESFWLFTLGAAFLGTHTAFWQYYRFAAADTASATYRSRAISYVLAGGVVSAILGPELAIYSRELLAPVLFAGNFVVMAILCLTTITVLQFVKIQPPTIEERSTSGRPLHLIARQPKFITAVLSAMCGYGVMVLVMDNDATGRP